MNDARPLKQVLLNEYGSFADKRIKNIDRGNTFIADDRGIGDYDARKQLFSWFCMIFVEVIDANTVKVCLRGGVPSSASVTAWVQQWHADKTDESLVFDVTREHLVKLPQLAAAFRSIVRCDAPHYAVKAYKFVCPRTANALDRLHRALANHWV